MALDFDRSLLFIFKLGAITELNRTYSTVFIGLAIICFDIMLTKMDPSWFVSLCELVWVLRGFVMMLDAIAYSASCRQQQQCKQEAYVQ